MGTLGEEHATFRYDHHDNPIEETTEDASREVDVDENGTVRTTAENIQRRHVRFDYEYDAQGNWTERVVSIRPESRPDYQPSNVERRTITYFTV